MKTATLLVAAPLIVLAASGCATDTTRREPADSATHASTLSAHAQVDPPTILPGQPGFDSQQQAVDALRKAAAAGDLSAMARTLGLPEEDVVSPDSAANAQRAAMFTTAASEFTNIVPDGDSRARVFIGKNNYPLASPLVRVGGKWYFDSAGGKQELLARAIGENELATIAVCHAYVQAQYEYYAMDRNGDDVLEYAQKLGSSRGQHDGLYWPAEGNEPDSPLGPLVAQARASGYLRGSVRQLDEPKPYHGYIFQVLTAQGENAAGGKYSYIINGRMIAGFALVAYPAKWNHTGATTFLVAANGKVYQKNLGDQTESIAGEMTDYNPDSTWTLVDDDNTTR
jgi:hypothetical protein